MLASPASTSKWSRAISCAAIIKSAGLPAVTESPAEVPLTLSLYKKSVLHHPAALAQVFIPSEPGSNSSFEKIRVLFYLVESTEWSSLFVTPEQMISSRCWSALSK